MVINLLRYKIKIMSLK